MYARYSVQEGTGRQGTSLPVGAGGAAAEDGEVPHHRTAVAARALSEAPATLRGHEEGAAERSAPDGCTVFGQPQAAGLLPMQMTGSAVVSARLQ